MQTQQLRAIFITQALAQDVRLDGRTPFAKRAVHIEACSMHHSAQFNSLLNILFHPHTQIAHDDQSATVRMGNTMVQCSIHATLVAPRKARGNEGTIHFNVDLGPAAAYDGRQDDTEVDIQRFVERALRDSGAVDQEALCVLPGRQVWALQVAIHVLDAAGNLTDACMLAALAALMAFRRPVVEVDPQGTMTVFPADQREPLPLSLHHHPVATTFAVFSEVVRVVGGDDDDDPRCDAAGQFHTLPL